MKKISAGFRIIFVFFVCLSLFPVLASCGSGVSSSGGGSSSAAGAPAPGSSGVITLTWTAPTVNIDLTGIDDLAGYNIYYGTTSGVYTATKNSLGAATSNFVSGLTPGTTYYFVVTAYDSSGNESSYSNEVSKVAP